MGRFHATPKGNIPFTAEEEEARDLEEAEAAASKPMQNWFAEMRASDEGMSRIEEDMIFAMDAATRARLPRDADGRSHALERYEAKKAIRARKP